MFHSLGSRDVLHIRTVRHYSFTLLIHEYAIYMKFFNSLYIAYKCWWHGTVVERRSLAGELSLSCARPAADG